MKATTPVAHANIIDPVKGHKLKLEDLEDRMKTFTLPPQWDGPVDYQSMAEAGFVYTGQEDLVYCFSCNIKLDRWSKHMEPLLRHKEESPTCSFMRQKLRAVKGEKGKTKSIVAPSKPLNARLTSSIGQLQSSSLVTSKAIHTVVTGLNESRLPYGGSIDDRPEASLPITPENYQSEEERIKSFVGWPLNEAVHPEQLARVGFVYTGEGALVQCFQCGVKYRHWYKGDAPLNVHQKCNPRCLFLQTLTCKSKALFPEQDVRPTKSYVEPESIGCNTEGEAVSKHSLQFPDYSEEAIRLQSFKHWGGVLPAQELAEGGFYMIARRDVVRCFSCNVVVQDWENSGNVIEEHYKHSPSCNHLHRFLSSKNMNNVEKPSNESLPGIVAGTFGQPRCYGSPSSDSHDCSTVFMSNRATIDINDHCSEQFVVSVIVYTKIPCGAKQWLIVSISYNMGMSALPNMYARSPRAEGIHIRQSTSAHVITNMLHFWHSENQL